MEAIALGEKDCEGCSRMAKITSHIKVDTDNKALFNDIIIRVSVKSGDSK
jgi:hypothetical protein